MLCSILELHILPPLPLFLSSLFLPPSSRQRDSLKSALLPIMWTSSSLFLLMLIHQSSEYVGEGKRGRGGGAKEGRMGGGKEGGGGEGGTRERGGRGEKGGGREE